MEAARSCNICADCVGLAYIACGILVATADAGFGDTSFLLRMTDGINGVDVEGFVTFALFAGA